MAAKSKHWADVFVWIYEVIDSCVTSKQALSAKRLIRNYRAQYPSKKPYDYMWCNHEVLRDYVDAKFIDLMNKEIQLQGQ